MMHFIFWWHLANGRWIKSEADGDADKLRELCNAAIQWETAHPGCECRVYSPGYFSTASVHQAPDKLAENEATSQLKAALPF